MNCTWMLKADEGSYVNFEIDYFLVKNNKYSKMTSLIFVNDYSSFQLRFGDFLSFFDGRDLQSQQILKLDKSSNYKKLTISSIGKDMLVQFLTDDQDVFLGFRSYFHYIPIDPNCAKWLNMTAQLLKSPDYPTIHCSWVITAPTLDSAVIIHFETFEVKCISLQIFSIHLVLMF